MQVCVCLPVWVTSLSKWCIIRYAMEMHKANIRCGTKECIAACWFFRKLPPEKYVKLNTDGSHWRNIATVGAGGLFRDSNEQWVYVLVFNLERASCVVAEIWGSSYGLWYARVLKFSNVQVESNSTLFVSWIENGLMNTYPCSEIIESCRDAFKQNTLFFN